MSDFKDSWKQTGSGLGNAFKGLGKTLINTGKKGVDHAVDWAGSDTNPQATQPSQGTAQYDYQPPQSAAQYDYQPPQQSYTAQPAPQAQPPQPAAAPPSTVNGIDPSMLVADEIKKLAELKNQGILTEEEFTAKKKQLLNL